MELIATNPRSTENPCRSNCHDPTTSLNDNADDFSVAVTVKQSNVTIEVRNSFHKYMIDVVYYTKMFCTIKK